MAQKKKKPSKQSAKNYIQQMQKEYDKRRRAFRSDKLLQDYLLMEDISPIRDVASKYDECEQVTLYSFLMSSFLAPPLPDAPHQNSFSGLLESYGDKMMLCFTSATVEVISGWYLRMVYPQELGMIQYDFADIRKRFITSIPKEFRQSGKKSPEGIRHFPFTHPLDSIVSSCIDWQAVFRGNDFCVWAKRCFRIIQNVLPEYARDALNSARRKLIVEFAADIGEAVHQRILLLSKSVLSDTDIDNLLGANIPTYTRSLTSEKKDISLQSLSPAFAAISSNQCLYDLIVYYSLSKATNLILEETPAGILPYTVLSLLARCKSTTLCSLFAQSLTFAMVFILDNGDKRQLDFLNRNEKKISIRTDSTLSVPKKYWEDAGFSPKLKDEDFGVSLSCIAYQFGNVILPHKLEISTKWERVLEDLGLSRVQAFAFCGYLEGASAAFESGRINPSEKDVPPIPDTDDIPSMEDLLAQSREQAKSEVIEAMQEAEAIRERAELTERRSQKEVRSAQHDVEVLSARNQTLEEQLREANQALKRAQSEQRELQKTILDLSAQVGNADDEAEIDLKANFPSDIGKTCRFVVVGGPQNWVSEQSKRFPYILFYDADNRPDEAIIKGADILMVNTFVLTHKYFDMVQDVAGKAGLPLHYFAYKGINRGSEAIISTYNEYVATIAKGE